MTRDRDPKPLLPFATVPKIELAPDVRQQCRTLLVELLLDVLRSERSQRRPSDE
jgi:hypothetical protein